MAPQIHLLGRPFVVRDGAAHAVPRGRKAWGLLAYLLLSERAPGREQLAGLLFGEADDPQRALRWNLAELRTLLGDPALLQGEPPAQALPPGTRVDTGILASGDWREALALPGLDRELLEGMAFDTSPAFEAWLLVERRHLATLSQGVLREGVEAHAARNEFPSALRLAARLVALDPLSEDAQELLIRTLVRSGDRTAAERQLAACRELFRRELGVEPGRAVLAAAKGALPAARASSPSPQAARAALEAGAAAIAAGTLDAGLGMVQLVCRL